MPISATCPGCRSSLSLPDDLCGKKIRCKQCGQVMLVGSAGPPPQVRVEGYETAYQTADTRLGSHPAQPDSWDDDEPARPRRRLRDDDRPRRRRRRRGRGLIFVLLGGCALAFVVAGVGLALWLSGRDKETATAGSDSGSGAQRSAARDIEFLGPWPVPMMPGHIQMDPAQTVTLHIAGVPDRATEEGIRDRAGALLTAPQGGATVGASEGGRMTLLVCPVADPEAYARKIDFGDVRSVQGRVITLTAHKLEGPPDNADEVSRSLFYLKSPNMGRRWEAAGKLSRAPPDHRRPQVARALEACINDPDPNVRRDVLDALGSWGTPESVPLLIKGITVPETGDHAVRALGKLKDPRAIEPLAAAVPIPFLRHEANVALKEFGTAAEKPVLKLLDHPERDVRFEACDILKVCGTPASIRALAKQAEDPDPGLSRCAKDAIQAINGRL
jgi:hypothetical protein